jgi:hypothetical protein
LRDRLRNFADLLDACPDDPEFNALRRSELIGKASRLAGLSQRCEPQARSRGDASQTKAKAEGHEIIKRE